MSCIFQFLVKSYAQTSNAFIEYQRLLPFESAIPVPPSRFATQLWCACYDVCRSNIMMLLFIIVAVAWSSVEASLTEQLYLLLYVVIGVSVICLAPRHISFVVYYVLQMHAWQPHLVYWPILIYLFANYLCESSVRSTYSTITMLGWFFPFWLIHSTTSLSCFSLLTAAKVFLHPVQQVLLLRLGIHIVQIGLYINLALSLLDLYQRRLWTTFHQSLTDRTVPHVREIRFASSTAYPLSNWHLKCEDGRQRWMYVEPSLEESCNLFTCTNSAIDKNDNDNNNTDSSAKEVDDNNNNNNRCNAFFLQEMQKHNNNNDDDDDKNRNNDANGEIWLDAKVKQHEWFEKYELGLPHDTKVQHASKFNCLSDHLDCSSKERCNNKTQILDRAIVNEKMERGASFLLRLQDPFSGHWPNDYSGCLFLAPGIIFTEFIISNGKREKMFTAHAMHSDPMRVQDDPEHTVESREQKRRQESHNVAAEATRSELIRYFRNYQNVEDGGWGQHTEGHSTMLGTSLIYVAMRLLGVSAEDEQLTRAREWIKHHGGLTHAPMWAKAWLAVLNLYSYNGLHAIPPELILLPNWFPFSLYGMWCHSRVVALPLSYFYGTRYACPCYNVLNEIRNELYSTPSYEEINWSAARGKICSDDLYTPPSFFCKGMSWLLDRYEHVANKWIRSYSLSLVWRHIAFDDENTNFICLGPVNKSMNMLITYIREGAHSVRLRKHEERVADYLYMSKEGLRMNGYNGSQLWDTSFAIQALCACQVEYLYPQQMSLAQHYIDVAQVQCDPMCADYFLRHRTCGAWNFSTRSQSWQVSDCTAEGLRAVLLLLEYFTFPTKRLYDAVDEILSLQNTDGDGGWCSYEPRRGPRYAELLNSSELFKDDMVEYTYTECTSSCVHSLALFHTYFPAYRSREVLAAIADGVRVIVGKQDQQDGSSMGSWGVNYTYAAWLATSALHMVKSDIGLQGRRLYYPGCVDFLTSHRVRCMNDAASNNGNNNINDNNNKNNNRTKEEVADSSLVGWGESVHGCIAEKYVPLTSSDRQGGPQVVNTAWAVMALLYCTWDDKEEILSHAQQEKAIEAITDGVRLLLIRQEDSGDWPQERISGIFNGNNAIHYAGYKNVMPLWALGLYKQWCNQKTLQPKS